MSLSFHSNEKLGGKFRRILSVSYFRLFLYSDIQMPQCVMSVVI